MRNIIFPRTSTLRVAVLFWILLIGGGILFLTQVGTFGYDENCSARETIGATVLFNGFIIAIGALRLIASIKDLYASKRTLQEDLTGFRIAHGQYLFAWNAFLGSLALVMTVCISYAFLPPSQVAGLAFFYVLLYMTAIWITYNSLCSALSKHSLNMRALEKKPEAQESETETEKGGQP